MTRFFFGFAGIPEEIYADVERENRRFSEKAEFCMDKMPNGARYLQRNINFFVERFHKKISLDQTNSLQDMAFAVIYIKKDEVSTTLLVNAFFPHMLLVPVQWELDLTRGPAGMRASRNELIPLLAEATAKARASLRALQDEIVSRASNTPFLLPVKNFDSKHLESTLRALHLDLTQQGLAPEAAIRVHVKAFKHAHPPQRIPDRQRDCFVDDSQIEFHSPGSHRHGFARAAGKHPADCVLSGRRRLGAPYDPLFHYDCLKGKGNLKVSLHSCHDPKGVWEGNPNINVAPNDNVNVRGNQAK